jgi:glycosyltransferase involved in cell wall biosynthesis
VRILWHSPPPNVPFAYAIQTALFAPRIRDLGHEVVISQMSGSPNGGTSYEGIPIIGNFRIPRKGDSPQPEVSYQLPRPMEIRAAFGGREPQLVLALKDAWVLDRKSYAPRPAAVWLNFDTEGGFGCGTPMGRDNLRFFRDTGARPIPVSKWALSVCRDAGFADAAYIPHGVETAQWYPPGRKDEAKTRLGIDPEMFVAGINAANMGVPPRKAFAEQFAGFAQFHVKHPRSVLLCNCLAENPDGINLRRVAAAVGLVPGRDVLFPEVWQDATAMRSWYQALDVLLQCTYGEGFGVPLVEAHACGVPVIASRCTALTEKIRPGTGWLVGGTRWWHPNDEAWWLVPDYHQIAGALEKAARSQPQPDLCVQAAGEYDADRVTSEYWKPFLDSLEA